MDADGVAPQDATPIGTFRCWGWIFDGETFGAAVSQAYEFNDRGTIYTHGREGTPSRAITGGVGEFDVARGQVDVEFINPANFSFRATFNLA